MAMMLLYGGHSRIPVAPVTSTEDLGIDFHWWPSCDMGGWIQG